MTDIFEKDPYEKLAQTLYKIPQGFNLTEDGTHLRVLRWIFTPSEAALAASMKLRPETPQAMAERLQRPVSELETLLPQMKSKGQITSYAGSDGIRYGLMPFVVGIFEEQLDRMDEEFAQLMEEYFRKTKYSELFGNKPEIFRVIPINHVIKPELTVFHFQAAEAIINGAKSWGVRECICKKQQELLSQACEYSSNVCMNFSNRENAFENHPLTKPITRQEALELLRETEDEGLIHNAMNIETGQNYICNCCTCCCGVLRGLVEWEQPTAFVKSDYQMQVDQELCIACGSCVDRCQLEALELEETCVVNLGKCIGCGVCAVACEEGAMNLVRREESEITHPPRDFKSWMQQKAMSRRVDPSDLL